MRLDEFIVGEIDSSTAYEAPPATVAARKLLGEERAVEDRIARRVAERDAMEVSIQADRIALENLRGDSTFRWLKALAGHARQAIDQADLSPASNANGRSAAKAPGSFRGGGACRGGIKVGGRLNVVFGNQGF